MNSVFQLFVRGLLLSYLCNWTQRRSILLHKVRLPFPWQILLTVPCLVTACAANPVVTTRIANSEACSNITSNLTPVPLLLDKENKFSIDPTKHCFINSNGKLTSGILFSLPEFRPGYYVSISSLAKADSILPLRVQTLDHGYRVRRTLSPERVFYRGAALSGSVFFNSSDIADRFLLVSAEPTLIGQTTEHMVLASQTTTLAAGALFFSFTNGTESVVSRTFTFNGELEISVGDYPGS